jgi:hypothetical protein
MRARCDQRQRPHWPLSRAFLDLEPNVIVFVFDCHQDQITEGLCVDSVGVCFRLLGAHDGLARYSTFGCGAEMDVFGNTEWIRPM